MISVENSKPCVAYLRIAQKNKAGVNVPRNNIHGKYEWLRGSFIMKRPTGRDIDRTSSGSQLRSHDMQGWCQQACMAVHNGTTAAISTADSGAMKAISVAPQTNAIEFGSQFQGNGFQRF
mmetsp:Transcript_79738/g.221935  ORF Transcript_79738/g.221935 Transcript_79738/m.221935 type:complete len:120 (-) Transcript_79738:302-661(-)